MGRFWVRVKVSYKTPHALSLGCTGRVWVRVKVSYKILHVLGLGCMGRLSYAKGILQNSPCSWFRVCG